MKQKNMLYLRTCKICGARFESNFKFSKTCSNCDNSYKSKLKRNINQDGE